MEVWWIKLKLSMFDDEKIKVIESMTGGDTMLVVWIKLLVMAGKCNSGGRLVIAENINYTPEMIAAVIGRPSQVVTNALNMFQRFGMIELGSDGSIYIQNWEKHQNEDKLEHIRESNRLRKQKERENKRLMLTQSIETNATQGADSYINGHEKCVTDMCDSHKKSVTVTPQSKSKNKITVSKDTVSTSKVGDILFSSIKENFLQAYKSHSGAEYYWQAKDAASLNRFIKMLSAQVKSRNQEATASDIADASGYFFASITDAWILEHFSMAVIASKFNEIIAQIRNSHTAQAGTSSRVAHNAGAYASIMNIIDQKYEQSTR